MQLTWLDNNSWLMKIAGKCILLDPWLVGSLVFGNLDWLFKATKQKNYQIPDKIDLILLSQGLNDHTHPETLKTLDRNIPVVGSPNAAKVVKDLGYKQVTALPHEETYSLEKAVTIKAVPGSQIGPQLVENGYIITDLVNDKTLYYEPHGYHSPLLKNEAPIDAIVTPIAGLSLLHLLPVLKGQTSTLEVCQWLQPQVILSTASASETDYTGFLPLLLREQGTFTAFRELLAKNHLKTQVIVAKPGEPVQLCLQPRTVNTNLQQE